jgi:hypothetical protein
MFQAAINQRRGIALVRVSGRFEPAKISLIDRFIEGLAKRGASFDLILDFTGVSDTAMPVQDLAKRSEQPPLWPGRERVLVAPQPVLHAMLRLFAGYQEHYGIRRPVVVGKLEEALKRLDTEIAEFQPVEAAEPSQAMTALPLDPSLAP